MKTYVQIALISTTLPLTYIADTSFAAPPNRDPQHVYWGAWQIHRSNLDGSGVMQIADPGGPYSGMLVDRRAGLLYIVDGYHLRSTNLDGSNEQTVWTFPRDFYNGEAALDHTRGHLYLNDAQHGAIFRVNTNGQNAMELVPPLTGPGGVPIIDELALDLVNNKLYWTQWPTFSSVQFRRSNLDGSNIETLFTFNDRVGDFALDVDGGKIYWTEFGSFAGQGGVLRANLDGTHRETLVGGLWGVAGLALDIPGNKIYFSDHWTAGPTDYDGKIFVSSLDGSGLQVLHNLGPSNAAQPFYVVLDPLVVPEPSAFMLTLLPALLFVGRIRRHLLSQSVPGRIGLLPASQPVVTALDAFGIAANSARTRTIRLLESKFENHERFPFGDGGRVTLQPTATHS